MKGEQFGKPRVGRIASCELKSPERSRTHWGDPDNVSGDLGDVLEACSSKARKSEGDSVFLTQVYRTETFELRCGDRIRWTRNG